MFDNLPQIPATLSRPDFLTLLTRAVEAVGAVQQHVSVRMVRPQREHLKHCPVDSFRAGHFTSTSAGDL